MAAFTLTTLGADWPEPSGHDVQVTRDHGAIMPPLTDEIAFRVLPEIDAPPRFPEGVQREAVLMLAERLQSQVTRKALLWVTALQAHIEKELWLNWANNIPGFQGVTYGFVPVAEGSRANGGIKQYGSYVFGVAIEIEPGESPDQAIELLRYENIPFACVFNRRPAELHVANPNFPVGTGACWARSQKRKIQPASDGVLTAAHVVQQARLRGPVSMDAPGLWHLGDRGTCKIDAALVVQTGCIPSGTSRLPIQYHPIGTTDVFFDGVGTAGTVHARITHTITHPTYLSGRNPMRVFFDKYGVSGDSGALIREKNTGLGVALYMGRELVPPFIGAPATMATFEGVAQHLGQAEYVLQAELSI